jgi:hypothetical protein
MSEGSWRVRRVIEGDQGMKTTSKLRGKGNSIADLDRNKQTVIAFYSRAFNDHEPADAVAKYVGSEYIQHNPDTPNGADAFIQSATGFIAKSPQVSVEINVAWGPGHGGGGYLPATGRQDCRTLGCPAARP